MLHTKKTYSQLISSDKKTLGFTLVELIVVVTILAILATIGFVSYSSYLTGVRDTNRLAQLVSISDGLELYSTKNNLPLPDDNIEVQANGTTIAYQGYAGANTLETIDFTKGGKDPRDDQYFTYYLTKDRKHYQLMGFLEESLDATSYINNSQLASMIHAGDYDDRIPTVYGKKLGILTDTDNTPIQDLSITSLDVVTEDTTSYVAHLSDESTMTGATAGNSNLAYLGNNGTAGGIASSCKTLIDRKSGLKGQDGVYLIDPEGGSPFPVYCEMTTDGGGWTLVDNIANNSDTMGARTSGVNIDLSITKGSLLPVHYWSGEPQLLCKADFYTGSKNWVTFDILSDDAKLYPTTAATSIGNGSSGDFSVDILNENTYYYLGYPGIDTGLGHWYSSGIWLGYGSSSTCSCGYGTNSGVGGNSGSVRICSTWVR